MLQIIRQKKKKNHVDHLRKLVCYKNLQTFSWIFVFYRDSCRWAITIPCTRAQFMCTRTLFSFTSTSFCIHTELVRTDTFFVYTYTYFNFLFRTYKLEVPLIWMLIIGVVPQWDTTKHDEDMALVIGRFKLTLCCCLI